MAIPPPLPIPAPAKPAPRVSDELAQSVVEQLWFGDPDPERTLSEASGSFAAALGRSLALKPFPKTASEAMGLLAHPETPVERVTRVLEHDLALSSRLAGG